ncbi:SAM-dependent methyltransferase [Actinomadura yumaensis]|uniref:SAM-dependent methyltransferase n=1 Tax=Actinomadura yumaensis TaxID=111807 RepID=A0ABW2CSS5_9ACTN
MSVFDEDVLTGAKPSVARVYDFFLGGKDNYPVDREFAHRLAAACPAIDFWAEVRWNRLLMLRAARFAARDGIDQFIDIGTGIPLTPNLHEVAQQVNPGVRAVYVDNDPVVLAHARALLPSTPQGATAYIDADLRDPQEILRQAAATLDLDRPIALSLVAVLHFVRDDEGPYEIVAALRDALAPGSRLVITHAVKRPDLPDPLRKDYEQVGIQYQAAMSTGTLRTPEQVGNLFGDWPLLDPGQVDVPAWRSEEHIDVPLWRDADEARQDPNAPRNVVPFPGGTTGSGQELPSLFVGGVAYKPAPGGTAA